METTLEKETPGAEESKGTAISLVHLQHALTTVAPAIPTGNAIPVLQSVRIEQLAHGLAFEATDLTIAIRALAPLSCGLSKTLVIPSERFLGLAKLLQGQEVKITATATRATLQCGRNRSSLPLMSANLWPEGARLFKLKGDGVTLKQKELARALKFASLSIGDETRYTLNGVQMQGDGNVVRFISTDGHRMVIYTMPMEEKVEPLLLPQRFVKVILPILGDNDEGVDITSDATMIVASIPAETPVFLSSKRISGQFPNWNAVYPKNTHAEVTVNAKEFLLCLERAVLLSNVDSKAVALTFGNGQIKIESNDPQAGEAEELVDAAGGPEKSIRIGVCATFLIQILKKLDGEVRIALPKDGQGAMLFKASPEENETLDYIVMPMRMEK